VGEELVAGLISSKYWLLTCQTRFGAISGCQEQIREGDKAQSEQYLAG